MSRFGFALNHYLLKRQKRDVCVNRSAVERLFYPPKHPPTSRRKWKDETVSSVMFIVFIRQRNRGRTGMGLGSSPAAGRLFSNKSPTFSRLRRWERDQMYLIMAVSSQQSSLGQLTQSIHTFSGSVAFSAMSNPHFRKNSTW